MQELILKLYDTFEGAEDLFTAAGLVPVRCMDLYRGQPQAPEQFEYYDLPALFFDFSISWSLEGKYYNGLLTLDVHVVTDATWDTGNISTNKLEGLKKTTFIEMVRRLLDGVSTNESSKLKRVAERPMEAAVTNYHVLTYNCNYYDPHPVGTPLQDALPEGMILDGKLVKKL